MTAKGRNSWNMLSKREAVLYAAILLALGALAALAYLA